jgi:AP-1 complex subunit mu
MPELKLGLNDKALFEAQGKSTGAPAAGGAGATATGTGKKSVELEDMKFHQCVRLTRFESDRTISFIPPDGEFELMSYRLNTSVKPLIWVETVIEMRGRSRVEYSVKARSQFKPRSYASPVEIMIPVPPDVDSPSFKASQGSATYVPDADVIKWSIKQVRVCAPVGRGARVAARHACTAALGRFVVARLPCAYTLVTTAANVAATPPPPPPSPAHSCTAARRF